MSIVPPVLFALAAVAAALTIWKSLAAALPTIRALREQLAAASQDRPIHIGTLDTRCAADDEAPVPRCASRRDETIAHGLVHHAHAA